MSTRRDELLAVADDLWLSRGYAGFSFADLSKATGLRKPSVHHHFPAKEALLLALVSHHANRAQGFYEVMDALPAEAALAAFLQVYGSIEEGHICPAGALCTDLDVIPASCAEAGRAYLAAQQRWLHSTLARGPWEVDAEDMAATILGALQGSLQRRRAEDPTALMRTLRTVRQLLGITEAG